MLGTVQFGLKQEEVETSSGRHVLSSHRAVTSVQPQIPEQYWKMHVDSINGYDALMQQKPQTNLKLRQLAASLMWERRGEIGVNLLGYKLRSQGTIVPVL